MSCLVVVVVVVVIGLKFVAMELVDNLINHIAPSYSGKTPPCWLVV